jgi:hypothetical protein
MIAVRGVVRSALRRASRPGMPPAPVTSTDALVAPIGSGSARQVTPVGLRGKCMAGQIIPEATEYLVLTPDIDEHTVPALVGDWRAVYMAGVGWVSVLVGASWELNTWHHGYWRASAFLPATKVIVHRPTLGYAARPEAW